MAAYIFLEPVPLTAGSWYITEALTDAKLMLEIHFSGRRSTRGTVPHAIMKQLVKEGKSQIATATARTAEK